MKQLFYNGKATTMFFKNEDTIDKIAIWVSFRMNDSDNPFNLNERYSCRITDVIENIIFIRGDEDSLELLLEDIKPIDISTYA